VDVGFVKITSDCFCGNGLQVEYSVLLQFTLLQYCDFSKQPKIYKSGGYRVVLQLK
jgi:hypothetical protein